MCTPERGAARAPLDNGVRAADSEDARGNEEGAASRNERYATMTARDTYTERSGIVEWGGTAMPRLMGGVLQGLHGEEEGNLTTD